MNRICLMVVLSLFSFLILQPVQAQDTAVQTYINANTLFTQKSYDAAIADYQTAIQASPRFWQAYQGLGNCYYSKGDTTTALTYYQKSLTLNPDNAQLAQFVQSMQQAPAPPPAVSTTQTYTDQTPLNNPTNQNTTSTPVFDKDHNPNLPKQGNIVFELEDSDWIGSWGDLQEFFNNQITTTGNVYGVKLGAGGAYAVSPNFQIGAKIQYLTKTPQVLNTSGLTATYTENAMGGALEAELTSPMNDGVNFLGSLQAGFYTLIGTNLTATGSVNGTANFTGNAPGFMASASIELLMNPQKTWALDLGLNYQYLRFSTLTDTPQTGVPFTLKNPTDGTNAYFDFSGIGLSLGARFF